MRRIKQSHLKLVTNRSKCPNLLHFSLSHTHTFHRHAEVRSLRVSKAPPNYELLPTIIIIKRGLQPHKSTHNHSQALPHSHHCPTLHSHIHTRTMATPEPRDPLCNPHKDTNQSLSHQRGKRMIVAQKWRKIGEIQKLEFRLCGECADNILGSYYFVSVSSYHPSLINH